MSNASSVDNSGGDGGKGEEGDGHVDGHQQADHQDGEQGEADADEHVVDDEAHHLVEESAMGRSKVQWIEPDKDPALKLLIMITSVKGNQQDEDRHLGLNKSIYLVRQGHSFGSCVRSDELEGDHGGANLLRLL